MDQSAVSARLIGTIFVEKGLVTEAQLEAALEQQRTTGERLGEILVEHFGIERLDLASALADQWAEYERQGNAEERESLSETRDAVPGADDQNGAERPRATPTPSIKRPIGEIFVERGLVEESQLDEALEQQRKTGGRLGEILIASGKLSRLELASALADQWASFQKLRPPDESEAPPPPSPPAPAADVLPTPEAVMPPPPAVAAGELGNRVDALAARIDQVATEKVDWKPQLEKMAELLRARLEHLEELVARYHDAEGVDVRGEIAALAERIEAIPAPTDEWRLELSQVAENLRTRIERVEQTSAAEQLAALQTTLAGLVERVDSLAQPSDEWRAATAELAGRMDALASSSHGWQGAIAELSSRIDSLPAPTEDWRDAIAELSSRVDSLPAPSEEWRDAINAVEARIAELGAAEGSAGDDVRGALDALVARVDSLPTPSEEWRGEIATIREQIEQAAQSRETDVGELLGLVDALGSRVDALPVDAWRPELAEVAENLRTRVERVEQRASGSEDTAELRAELKDLAARVDSLPQPSEEWRELVAGLAARVDALPVDAWRPELTEVAENLRTRVERVEQRSSGSEEAEQLRAELRSLEARVESLPQPSEEWRGEIAGLREQIEQRSSGSEEAEQLRAELRSLEARVESLPQPSEEWRELVAGLSARVEGLPVDAWRPELAEVAENLRTRVERVEQRPTGLEELEALRAGLTQLAARVESLPQPSEEWRELIAQLAARVDAVTAEDSSSDALDTIRKRIERVEEGMNGQARAAAVTEIAEQVGELARKVAATDADAVDQKLQTLAARLEAVPVAGEWREPLAQVAARIDQIPAPSEEWREQIAALAERVDTLPTDEWKSELAQVSEHLRTRLQRVEQELGNDHAAQLDGLRSGLDELVARVESTPVHPLGDLRAELAELAQALHGRMEQIEQRLTHEVRTDALDVLVTRVDELDAKIGNTSGLESRLTESLSALVHERAEQFEVGGAEVKHRLDDALREIAAVSRVAERVDEVESRLDAEGAVAAEIAPQLDELKQAADRQARRVEKLAGRIDELGTRRDATEVEESLGARLQAAEGALGEVRAAIDAVPASVEERIAAAESLVTAAAGQASADVESLRRELGALTAVVSATSEANATRIDAVSERLQNELSAMTEQFVRTDTVDELRSAIGRQDEHIEGFGGRLTSFERRVDDSVAGRTAELAAMRARLESVESALAGAGGWQDATEAAHARIESLENRLIETSSSEAVERNAEIESLRGELGAKVDALESAQAKRKDVKELRDAVNRVEARVADSGARDDETARAVEEAVREGLAGLGERLAATEETYLEAGRALRLSIAGLGHAIAGADAHLAGVSIEPAAGAPPQATSYVAFAPTSEGYRLVTSDGSPPVLGSHVEIPECEGVLVVTRVGASPLPFDRRPCVYLEPAQSSLLITRA